MDLDDIINSWISHANSTELDTNKSQHHFKITYQLYLNIMRIIQHNDLSVEKNNAKSPKTVEPSSEITISNMQPYK